MKKTKLDPQLHDLAIALMTRIGMIMEDMSFVALDTRKDGVNARVLTITDASAKIAALGIAARVLIEE